METAPKLGELLLKNGIITEIQLETALKEQQEHGGRLGPILILMGYISESDINHVLPPPPPSKLGERLIEKKLINDSQLQDALEYQQENGGLLGEALISLGYANRETIENNLMIMNRRLPIGEILVQDGAISKEQLKKALDFQRKSGGLLGDILLSLKMISGDVLYRYLANQNRLGRPGLNPDFSRSRELPFETAKKYQAVVVGGLRSRSLLAVSAKLEKEAVTEIETLLRNPIEQILVSEKEIDMYWARVYEEELSWESTLKMAKEDPHNSAFKTVTWMQRILIVLAFIAVGWGLVTNAFGTAIIINIVIQVSYFIMIIFKMFIMINGVSRDTQIRIEQEELDALDEKKLPVYTILVPLYKEKDIAARLLQNIEKLDYPKSKLDVRLLLEEDDTETIRIVRSLDLPAYYDILVVPHSYPKTKPKACNYGLINARGEYTVIFDAEDRPEPDQLKKAFLAFQRLPQEVICIQAKLNYYNSKRNIMTKWFTQEYSMWFELLLPGVMQLDIPLPLGGSSNHFKTEILKNIGAWDPFNVTEDADLGVRLYKNNYKTAVVASRTWEEAPGKISAWINQRSRWLKGYMQTWLVHMRNPFRLIKELDPKGFLGFQVTVFGTVFLPLVNPVFWLILIIWFATEAAWIPVLFPTLIYYASLFLLIFGNFFFVYTNIVGVYWVINDIRQKKDEDTSNEEKSIPFSYEIIKYALVMPFYWLYMSLAAYKALWQLIFKPSHWEKTEHGLYTDKDEKSEPAQNNLVTGIRE